MNNSIVYKILVVFFYIELIGLLLSYFTASGNSLPQIAQLQTNSNNLQKSASNIGSSLNYTLMQPLNSNGGVFGNALAFGVNMFIELGDILAKIFLFVVSILVFFGFAIAFLLYLLIFFLPGLFTNNLGVLGFLFSAGYVVFLIALAWVLFEVIVDIYNRVKP